MNDKAKIAALRAALEDIRDSANQWDNHADDLRSIAVAALTADDAEQAPDALNDTQRAAEALNCMLWLYRRLPRTYGRPPHIEWSILRVAAKVGVEVDGYFAERGHVTAPIAAEPAPKK